VALVAVLIVAAVPFCLRKPADWDDVYVPAAERLRGGEDIFQRAFVYPPASALLGVPFTYLPRMASLFLWYGISATALVVLVHGAWRLAGGGRFPGPTVPRREHLVLVAGCLFGLPFAFDCFGNRQTDLLVSALVVTGCLNLRAGRGVVSAVWFGLAAGLKCTPLLWAPYLALRRRFGAAAVVAAVAAGVNLVPDVLYPAADGSRLLQWVRVFLAPMARGNHDPGMWACGINFNHSVAGVANRWLVWERGWEHGQMLPRPRAARVTPATLKAIVYGTDIAILVLAVIVCRRRSGISGRRNSWGWPNHPLRAGVLEYCLVILLMLLLSPQSSKPHFCTLILPGFCLARVALGRRDAILGVILATAAVGAQLSNKDLWGVAVYDAVMWYGSVFWTMILLFVACIRARCCCGAVQGQDAVGTPRVPVAESRAA
jgi:hypothetical protein